MLTLANPNLGAIVTHSFRTNSLFDPDYTAGGHQPYQFDQLTGIYGAYIVYGMAYDLTFNDPSTDGFWLGVQGRPDTNTGSVPTGKTIDDMMERRLLKMRPLSNTGKQSLRMKGFIKNATLAGVSNTSYRQGQEIYGSGSTGNPNWGDIFLDVFACIPNTSTGNAATVNIQGKLYYYAKMYKYIAPNSS